jgi:DNA invertase Pin-like site-specific DNA recombinase
MSTPTRAALYFRMSDDRQEESIDRQKSQVLPYAEKHGYQVVREYVDEGITGSEIFRRKEFQRLLRDAQTGAFDLILCDDQDRFGRFDSIDLGEIAAPLRRKGVRLETVAQGEIDWNSFTGRLSGLVNQEAKNQEQHALSRRVLTQMLRMAEKGIFLGGPVPYGYRAVPDDDLGKRLLPDGRKAEVVKLVFDMYDHGHTLGQIAEELYLRGVASPSGAGRWSRNGLRKILKQRKYVGDWTWGVQRVGKRHRLTNGQVKEARRGEGYGRNPPEDWVIVPDTHTPLIDREQFERVQAKLQGNQKRTTPHTGGGTFLLGKLLVCGHCGALMLGRTRHGQHVYECGGYQAYGKAHCNRNTVHEKPIVDFLIRRLQEAFLDPGHLQKLRGEIAALEEARRSEANIAGLTRRLEKLDGKIRQGAGRLLELDKEDLADASAVMRDWRAERDRVACELHRIRTENLTGDLEDKISLAESALWKLRDALKAEDFPLLRQLLRELVSKIVLTWTHHKTPGGRNYSHLEGGVVYLRPQEDMSDLFPTGSRSSRPPRRS